jgi:transcriptional regulator PpsR
LLAVGRDLGAIVAIQQRFLDAQQEMERSYWRVRQAESRYRLLFQVATDAVMVINAETFEILEANQAAAQLFDMDVDQLLGRPASFGFERYSRGAVDELLTTARTSGQQAEIRARLLGKITATSVSATPIRSDDAVRLLVRVRAMDMPGSPAELNATLARLVDGASDGVVVTDSSGRIQIANPTFLKLVQMNTEADVKGRPLMDWVSVSDEQFATLLFQVRRQGITRRMASQLLSSDARMSQVEVSAALLTEGDQECIGFTIRFVAGTPGVPTKAPDDLQLAVAQLATQIGSTPLPELLRLATGLLERYFVRVAMERTNADPAAAAGLLGVNQKHMALLRGSTISRPGNSSPEGS